MTDNPAHHLSEAADAIRAFNHASFTPAPGWETPPHSYRALGSLAQLTGKLQQAVEQSVFPLMRTYEHGRLTVDTGEDTDRAINVVLAARRDAMQAAAALVAAVQRMHDGSFPMGLDTTGIPEFEDEDS